MNDVTTHREQKRNGCDKLEYEVEGEYLLPYVALEKQFIDLCQLCVFISFD